MTPLLFSTFEVTTQAFYRSSLSYAIVNLKPIVPGHVLVVPNRPVPRLSDLDENELSCLMRSIKRVGSVVEKVYGGDGLTIACQDGRAAGQTVPHVHFHLMPRRYQGDPFSEDNDKVYPALDNNESALESDLGRLAAKKDRVQEQIYVDADENRPPRTMSEMEEEATYLKSFFQE